MEQAGAQLYESIVLAGCPMVHQVRQKGVWCGDINASAIVLIVIGTKSYLALMLKKCNQSR